MSHQCIASHGRYWDIQPLRMVESGYSISWSAPSRGTFLGMRPLSKATSTTTRALDSINRYSPARWSTARLCQCQPRHLAVGMERKFRLGLPGWACTVQPLVCWRRVAAARAESMACSWERVVDKIWEGSSMWKWVIWLVNCKVVVRYYYHG